jgi:hypothetical protein
MSVYLYGVADATSPPRITEMGVGENGGSTVEVVERDGLVAVVSDLAGDAVPPTRRNLTAHTRVLEAAIDQGPLLPARFGTVLPDRDAVAHEVLEARLGDLRAGLDRVRGAVEMVVKGTYDESAVLAQIIREDRSVARLRSRQRAARGGG